MPWPTTATKKQPYAPVTEDDSSEDHVFENEKARMYGEWSSSWKRNLFFLIVPTSISIGTVIALLVMANLASHPHPSHHPAVSHRPEPPGAMHVLPVHHHEETETKYPGRTCGHTYQEARSRGCIFDTISFSWLPPICYDGELVEEFDKLIHTPFFYDIEGTKQATMDEVRRGERMFYVPWAHHLWHCGFLWRKMHKNIMAGTPVDSYIGNYTHTEHCSAIMAGEIHGMEEVNTVMTLKFPYCGGDELQWTAGTNYTGPLDLA